MARRAEPGLARHPPQTRPRSGGGVDVVDRVADGCGQDVPQTGERPRAAAGPARVVVAVRAQLGHGGRVRVDAARQRGQERRPEEVRRGHEEARGEQRLGQPGREPTDGGGDAVAQRVRRRWRRRRRQRVRSAAVRGDPSEQRVQQVRGADQRPPLLPLQLRRRDASVSEVAGDCFLGRGRRPLVLDGVSRPVRAALRHGDGSLVGDQLQRRRTAVAAVVPLRRRSGVMPPRVVVVAALGPQRDLVDDGRAGRGPTVRGPQLQQTAHRVRPARRGQRSRCNCARRTG